jgi:putative ATP-dependent endonuclease of OLD family
MRVTAVEVFNFRLLRDVTVCLDPSVTIVVGPNNSGKTSLVEVFYGFLGSDRAILSIDDFSVERLVDIREAGARWLESVEARSKQDTEVADRLQQEALGLIPSITLDIELSYEEDDDLAQIADLIMDLDPGRHDALISCKYRAKRPLELLKAFGDANARKTLDLVEYLRKKSATHFGVTFWAIDKNDDSNFKEIGRADVGNAVSTEFIFAQNQFDDMSADKGAIWHGDHLR